MGADDGARERRVAANEVLFREVNERIVALSHELEVAGEDLRFVCECASLECSEPLVLAEGDYRRVRSDKQCFAVVPGHEVPDAEDVVERHDRFVVVRKRVPVPPA